MRFVEQGELVRTSQIDLCLVERHRLVRAVDECLRRDFDARIVVGADELAGFVLHVGTDTELRVVRHFSGNGELFGELDVLDSLFERAPRCRSRLPDLPACS